MEALNTLTSFQLTCLLLFLSRTDVKIIDGIDLLAKDVDLEPTERVFNEQKDIF
jgi:hypothetical protein